MSFINLNHIGEFYKLLFYASNVYAIVKLTFILLFHTIREPNLFSDWSKTATHNQML